MDNEIENLLREIRLALDPLPPSLTGASHGSDLYEAYLFTLILTAARSEGAAITFETIHGTRPIDTFYFRTSPGHIYSTAWPYTHAIVELPGKNPLEVHVGVRVVGKSQVLHECDVALIDRQEAANCRATSREPSSSKVILAVEAKFYSASLSLGLGRGFIGLASDLSAKYSCFVANTTSASVARLLAHNKTQNWFDDATVGSNAVGRLESFFETVLHNYKAR